MRIYYVPTLDKFVKRLPRKQKKKLKHETSKPINNTNS